MHGILKSPWWYFALANWRPLAWFLKFLCWTVNLKILKSRKTKAATYMLYRKSRLLASKISCDYPSLCCIIPTTLGETVKKLIIFTSVWSPALIFLMRDPVLSCHFYLNCQLPASELSGIFRAFQQFPGFLNSTNLSSRQSTWYLMTVVSIY